MTQDISSPQLSVCSLSTDDDGGDALAHRIASTYARLQLVINEEDRLKKSLYELLNEQVAQAAAQLEQARNNCISIMEKQAEIRQNLEERAESLEVGLTEIDSPR
jgi:hypothetical protein